MTVMNPLVGDSQTIREIRRDLACAIESDVNILITGEAGVGKEWMATLIHRRSARAHGPLVRCQCAVPHDVLESELFGCPPDGDGGLPGGDRSSLRHAIGGTVFLNEVGEMSLRVQIRLMEFLERTPTGADRAHSGSSTHSARLISASNPTLLAQMADKTFREDLFYRLNVFHLALLPLRERREDIPVVLRYHLRRHGAQHDRQAPQVDDAAMARIIAYDWPGNVRELNQLAEQLVVSARSERVSLSDLPPEIRGELPPAC